MNPNRVTGPKNKIEQDSIKILLGSEINAQFSIATMLWNGKPRVGIRWNGENDESKGYPTSSRFGHPQWFIIPKALALSYIKSIGDVKMIEIINATSDDPLI